MLDQFLIRKKEIGKLKVTLKNTLALTCEKIIQNPRIYNTLQIKNATENLVFVDVEETILPDLLVKTTNFLLKDFFLFMHQTGLYNRQFKLWSNLANISHITFFKLQKRLLKKEELNAFVIELFIEAKSPCVSVIVNENKNSSYEEFKLFFSSALNTVSLNRLKGIFYLTNSIINQEFINKLIRLTNAFDPISKYESKIQNTIDTRLNVVSYKKEKDEFSFEHTFPILKLAKEIEV